MSVLGLSDESFKKSAGKTFSDVIEEQANVAIERMQKYLQNHVRPGGPKTLEQSILLMPTKSEGNKLTAEIVGEDYWNFVNKGVGGALNNQRIGGRKSHKQWVNRAPNSPFKFKDKPPPINYSSTTGWSLLQWANHHNFSPFALQESIYRQGLKPIPFVDSVINDKFIDEFAKRLTEVMSKTIEVDIKADFDGK